MLVLDRGGKDDPCPAIAASVGGVAVRVHIDSGSPGFITLLNKTQKQLPLEGEPKLVGRARTPDGSADVRAGKLKGTLKIGPFEYEDPQVNFADLGPMVRFDAGNIGYQFLKDFAITLDQKNHRVRLQQAKQGDTGTAEEETPKADDDRTYRAGFGLTPHADGWQIVQLIPGGAAEQADLRVDDIILTIAGKPALEIERDDLTTVFGKPMPIELEIQRGEEKISVTMTPALVEDRP